MKISFDTFKQIMAKHGYEGVVDSAYSEYLNNSKHFVTPAVYYDPWRKVLQDISQEEHKLRITRIQQAIEL